MRNNALTNVTPLGADSPSNMQWQTKEAAKAKGPDRVNRAFEPLLSVPVLRGPGSTTKRFSVALVVFFLAQLSTAADLPATRASLKGLNGVKVLVENLAPTVEQAGLTRNTIETDVELKLQQAGIRVDKEAPIFLSVLVTVNGNSSVDMWTYGIEVELIQFVSLDRDPSITVLATTWSLGGIGRANKGNERRIRDDVKDYIDLFINAYLSVNPK